MQSQWTFFQEISNRPYMCISWSKCKPRTQRSSARKIVYFNHVSSKCKSYTWSSLINERKQKGGGVQKEGQVQQLVHLAWNDLNISESSTQPASSNASKTTREALLLPLFLNSDIWIKQNLFKMKLARAMALWRTILNEVTSRSAAEKKKTEESPWSVIISLTFLSKLG